MDKRIDKEVLEYMGIYKTKEPTQEKINLGFKLKDEISKLTNFNIERIYIMDEYAWGKSDSRPSFCFLTDVRIRDIDKKFRDVEEYAFKININILVWSMCQFEKRKNNPTELDYYIENYGTKIYDSGKLIDIDEKVKVTEYASKMDMYRYYYKFEKNRPEIIMKDLLEIYALKIDYPINEKQNLENTIKYIKHISKDKNVLDAIETFRKEKIDKFKICEELEKYIKNLKQIRPKMELKNPPTMKVYEKFLEIKNKEGRLNINNLTKENLYTMQIIQEQISYNIAKLFDIDEKEVLKMRKKFGFKVIDSIWYENVGELVAKAVVQDMDNAYAVLKRLGIFNFEKHTYDILKYMRDGEKYLLKEFWKLTNGKREGLECEHATTAKDVYFRAYLCMELLKQNEFIEEVDYSKINISKEKIGKDSEKLVYDLEKERLIKENREDLAKCVFWESQENGDGAGYDIKSFEKKDGEYTEIYIEVKGTNKSINEPFDISKNEIEASNIYKKQYYIYRVANIYSNKPKFYKVNGKIEDNFKLEATNFKARKK